MKLKGEVTMYENNQVELAGSHAIEARPRSLTERLTDEKSRLEVRLAEIDQVLSGLKKNPETQELFDAIAKLGHFGY